MGLLSQLFGDEPQSQSPQKRDNGEWRYVADPCHKVIPDHVLFVEDGVEVKGTKYFQAELGRINEDTIDVWLVDASGVELVSTEWDFKKSDKELYVVTQYGVMIGYLASYIIESRGYSAGEKKRAAVTKPPSGGSEYGLFLLNAEHDRRRVQFGQDLSDGSACIEINIGDSDWLDKVRFKRRENADIELTYIPTPKGSRAKPHIQMLVDGKALFEIPATRSAYQQLANCIGLKPIYSRITRKSSTIHENGEYLNILMAFACAQESNSPALEHGETSEVS